jgi:hypothetical protein
MAVSNMEIQLLFNWGNNITTNTTKMTLQLLNITWEIQASIKGQAINDPEKFPK